MCILTIIIILSNSARVRGDGRSYAQFSPIINNCIVELSKMAGRTPLLEDAQDTKPTALLIGSYKYDVQRPSRYGGVSRKNGPKHNTRCKKGKRVLRNKKGDGYLEPHKFVEGDLKNMRWFLEGIGVDVCPDVDYREKDEETGEHARGKFDILDAVRKFFAQNDRNEFVLYFSGHGDPDGSWCIAVTTGESVTSQAPSSGGGDNAERSTTPVNEKGPADAQITESAATAALTSSIVPPPSWEYYDYVTYEDIVRIWVEEKKGRDERKLMLILDCCQSGRWVQKVNGECTGTEVEPPNVPSNSIEETKTGAEGFGDPPITENTTSAAGDEKNEPHPERLYAREDICIQAACHPAEQSRISDNQLSSFFTRSFIAAQTKNTFEKLFLTFFGHAFVFDFVSWSRDCLFHPFTPMKSEVPPFAGITFLNSFDDVHLQTP